MVRALSCAAAALVLAAGAARAMPGEMPWDHAGGPGRPDCTECHFDSEAVEHSPALRLEGLPERAVPGRSYDLVLRLEADGLETAGFLIRAQTAAAQEAGLPPGRFLPANDRTEAGEGAIRSTESGARQKRPGVAEWRFSWRAPGRSVGAVTMYAAATAANDDRSPLGDRVHLFQTAVTVEPPDD
ncbi:MAG: choice-of-anchor V domain-containing protein [Alphaproteobacteria bacterium]